MKRYVTIRPSDFKGGFTTPKGIERVVVEYSGAGSARVLEYDPWGQVLRNDLVSEQQADRFLNRYTGLGSPLGDAADVGRLALIGVAALFAWRGIKDASKPRGRNKRLRREGLLAGALGLGAAWFLSSPYRTRGGTLGG